MEQATLDAVLADWETAPVSKRTRAALKLLDVLVKRPLEIDAALLEAVREDGLKGEALLAVGALGFQFNLMNRLADSLDFKVPAGEQVQRSVRMLRAVGRAMPTPKSFALPLRRADGRSRPTEVATVRESMLSADGVTESALRRNVDARVREHWGLAAATPAEVPEELERYLEKLALYAYRISDEEFAAVRAAGYSDEAIYEITVTGALAAATVGVECLYVALFDH